MADTIHLSLAGARARAIGANPDLRAARLDIDIARGDLRQAGVLLRANPEADVLTRGLGTEVSLGQEIEIAGQRGARRAAARAGLERATAEVTDAARTTLGDVDRAFYGFVAADRRTALAEDVLSLNQRLAEVAQRQLQAGEISRLDFNLATVEFGRARGRALAARRERAVIMNELRRLLGLDYATPIVPVVDSTLVPPVATDAAAGTGRALTAAPPRATASGSPVSAAGSLHDLRRTTLDSSAHDTAALDVDSLTALALSRRPDLAERAAAEREAGAQVSVARREAFPNLVLRASSEPVEGTNARALRPGLGFTLPMFNRNQGEVEARRAAARQAELERSSLVARVRAEAARAVATYRSASAEAEVLETTVLAPARENRRLLEIAYREGKVGLPVLLLIRNQVIDAELEYWDAWLAEHEALAELAEVTGETVVDFRAHATP
jgi:cobalt-zinc-cadmium efflux system outer membrane protein